MECNQSSFLLAEDVYLSSLICIVLVIKVASSESESNAGDYLEILYEELVNHSKHSVNTSGHSTNGITTELATSVGADPPHFHGEQTGSGADPPHFHSEQTGSGADHITTLSQRDNEPHTSGLFDPIIARFDKDK